MGGYRKLGRGIIGRLRLMKSLVGHLVKHERIETTYTRAKDVKRVADKMITLAKKGTFKAKEKAYLFVRSDENHFKLFTELAHRYKDRSGGYTRVLRTRVRQGDASKMAYIEFVDREDELKQANPPVPNPPQNKPLDPWTKSRLMTQWAPPKPQQQMDPLLRARVTAYYASKPPKKA